MIACVNSRFYLPSQSPYNCNILNSQIYNLQLRKRPIRRIYAISKKPEKV